MLRRLITILLAGTMALLITAPLPAFAQQSDTDPETTELEETQQGEGGVVGEGDEAENPGAGGAEDDDPASETGVEEGGTAEAEAESGPVWTYQMSKIVVVLLLLMLLGIGGAYWNFVARRQKQGV